MAFHCQIARRFLPGMILWDHRTKPLHWVTEEALGPSETYSGLCLRG